MGRKILVLIDSNIITAYAARESPYCFEIDDILGHSEHGGAKPEEATVELAYSLLSRIECSVSSGAPMSDVDYAKVREFFDKTTAIGIPMSERVADIVADLYRKHKSSNRPAWGDMLIIASAIAVKSDYLLTLDGIPQVSKKKKAKKANKSTKNTERPKMLSFNETFGDPPLKIISPNDLRKKLESRSDAGLDLVALLDDLEAKSKEETKSIPLSVEAKIEDIGGGT